MVEGSIFEANSIPHYTVYPKNMAVDSDSSFITFIFIQFITCLFSLVSLKNLTVQESIKPVFYNLFLLCFVSMFFTVFFFLEFIECCTLDHLAQNTCHILH